MATADTLITQIRRRFQDETSQSIDSNVLIDALNEGADIFAATTGCCQGVATVTPDGSNSYIDLDTTKLTYRFVNIYAVEFGTTKLDFAPRHEAAKWAPTTATTPTGWSAWADGGTERMYFDEVPSSGSDIKVWFTYVPAAMTSTSSTCGIPEKWQPAIRAYARYYIHESNREEGLSARAYAEFSALQQSAAKTNESLMSRGGYSR